MQGMMNLKQSRKHTRQDFAVTMMLAVVVGAMSQIAQIVVEVRRSTGCGIELRRGKAKSSGLGRLLQLARTFFMSLVRFLGG
jgi:hypothetical protein